MARSKGDKNKVNAIGRDLARAVIEQNELSAGGMHPNPGINRLMEQFRAGVGSQEGLLPGAVFVHLLDRGYGKVVDRVKLSTNPSYDGEGTKELADRAERLMKVLRRSAKE